MVMGASPAAPPFAKGGLGGIPAASTPTDTQIPPAPLYKRGERHG